MSDPQYTDVELAELEQQRAIINDTNLTVEERNARLIELLSDAEDPAPAPEFTPIDMAGFSQSKLAEELAGVDAVKLDMEIEALETSIPTLEDEGAWTNAMQHLARARYMRDQAAIDTSHIEDEVWEAQGVELRMASERAMLDQSKVLAEGFSEDSETFRQAQLKAQDAVNALAAYDTKDTHRFAVRQYDDIVVDQAKSKAGQIREERFQEAITLAEERGLDTEQMRAMNRLTLDQLAGVDPQQHREILLAARDAVEAERGQLEFERYLRGVETQFGPDARALRQQVETGTVQSPSAGGYTDQSGRESALERVMQDPAQAKRFQEMQDQLGEVTGSANYTDVIPPGR